MNISPSGDSAIVICFGEKISELLNLKVRSLKLAIERQEVIGIIEMTPTYCSLMIHYNPLLIGYEHLIKKVSEINENLEEIDLPKPSIIDIPTLYGGEYGPDIENVARHNNLSTEEVIQIHASRAYQIYMLGFTPGFPYLGGMDERIATPRLATPRTKIVGGSVGIAGSQTGIYPIDSPGGWQIIGRTPLALYDPKCDEPILLKAGETIRFIPIDQETYDRMLSESATGRI